MSGTRDAGRGTRRGQLRVVTAGFERKDARGVFREVLNGFEARTFITGRMSKDAVLGNHYHRKTRVFFYLTRGAALVAIERERVPLPRLDVESCDPGGSSRQVEENARLPVVVVAEHGVLAHPASDEGARLEAVQHLAEDAPGVLPLEPRRDDPASSARFRFPISDFRFPHIQSFGRSRATKIRVTY